MYIAHPTHGAGTRPHRTQLKRTARKTTLNAGQCVRQPSEGEGGTGKPPPPKKKEGGGGKGTKTAHSRQTARQHHHRRPNPPPEGTENRTPIEAQGDHPPKTGNTKPVTAAHGEKGHRNGKKKKGRTTSPARKKGDGGTGTTKPGKKEKKEKNKRKNKSAKNTPRQPSQERAGHSRDPGPTHTPTPHAGTGNGGGQAGRPRNHTRPKSRLKPKPNHEHHKQPTLEGRRHKPCPNTPTQDPSQDWRG